MEAENNENCSAHLHLVSTIRNYRINLNFQIFQVENYVSAIIMQIKFTKYFAPECATSQVCAAYDKDQ